MHSLEESTSKTCQENPRRAGNMLSLDLHTRFLAFLLVLILSNLANVESFLIGGTVSHLYTDVKGTRARRASQRTCNFAPAMLQSQGYVIIPDKSLPAGEGGSSKPAGWTLWDQRTKGVTVVIGNAKQRRLSARQGKHFGPLAVPDLAKLQHKLKELHDEKKKLHAEVELAEKERRREEEISALKKKKLAVKDRINVLETTIKSYNPTDYQPKMLGEGAYGAILLGRDLATSQQVAIKVEPVQPKVDSAVAYEYSVYTKLQGIKGFPIVKYFGQQTVMNKLCRVMVMELLGPSIEDLWWEVTGGGRGFEVGTALALADEMLTLLENLHERGYVHRDVKPDNFLMHAPDGTGHLCLIDLGITKTWQLDGDKGHAPLTKGNEFFGTCRYASINAHQGLEQSRRDDLESLAYTIAFLLRGELPWEQPTSDVSKVGLMKIRAMEHMHQDAGCCVDSEEKSEHCALFEGMPSACVTMLQGFLKYVRALEYEQRPDYAHLRDLLRGAYKEVCGKDTYSRNYEWIEQKTPVNTSVNEDIVRQETNRIMSWKE